MFNNFFFDAGENEIMISEFISGSEPDEILIILDPPFGGLVNVLAKTITSLWKSSEY